MNPKLKASLDEISAKTQAVCDAYIKYPASNEDQDHQSEIATQIGKSLQCLLPKEVTVKGFHIEGSEIVFNLEMPRHLAAELGLQMKLDSE